MGTIKKHYEIELAKEKPNTLLLSILSKLLDRCSINLDEWRMSGKFTPREAFLLENPTEELLATCTEVIEYIGKGYIQVLSSGVFRYNAQAKSKVLDEVEDIMWNEIAKQFFGEECKKK
jgi:hypothetical protein